MEAYYLEWFDLLVTVTLDPQTVNLNGLPQKQLDRITYAIREQKCQVKTMLKRAVYKQHSRKSITLLVRRFYADLILLYDQARENDHPSPVSAPGSVQEEITACLEELLCFVERQYSDFMGLDERVPMNHLVNTRQDLALKLDWLKEGLFQRISDKRLTGLVFTTLYDFVSTDTRPVTFREMIYKKELVRSLEEISTETEESRLYEALVELLVYRNFNKKGFVNYLTEKTALRVNVFSSVAEKLDAALLAYKEFNQMHRKPGVRLNPHYPDIHKVIGNWFAQEISYLEKKHQFEVFPLQPQELRGAGELPKAQLIMNADQIAVLIRALADTGKVASASVNHFFKAVVPWVSSRRQTDLSWQSMRKRSYAPEDKDKQAVMRLLKEMEQIVEGY